MIKIELSYNQTRVILELLSEIGNKKELTKLSDAEFLELFNIIADEYNK